MEQDLEVSNMVETITRLPLPALSDILLPYDPNIKNTPPRPPNTYVLFRMWMSKLGDRQTVISHLIWREVKTRDATRGTVVAHFERLANEAKVVHARAYPDYKYRPVKRGLEGPSDVTRQRVWRKRTYKKRTSGGAIPSGSGSPQTPSEVAHTGGRRHCAFDLQPESLVPRMRAYQPVASTSSSVSTSAGRTFQSRYPPGPVISPEGHSPSAGSSHSHSDSRLHLSHSSHTYMSSSSSSSPPPRRSPSSSSCSSDSDFEFNFKYERERQAHTYRHREIDVDRHGYESDVQRSVNAPARIALPATQRQSFEYSDYDSDSGVLDQDA